MVINSVDILATKAFYEQHLGFRLSDWLEEHMRFLRTRIDHHILAISSEPHVALNHVSFEMRGVDEYMRGLGRLIRQGNKPLWGPVGTVPATTPSRTSSPQRQRHGVHDRVGEDPRGAAWVPRRFEASPEAADQWGTGGLITVAMIPATFNDPDKGLWIPAPF
ncbi:hypothetical protein ACWEFL_21335 [Streptomyces sp. NPDC004838]